MDVDEVIEVTIDSGAAKSVWPRRKGRVTRTKIIGKRPRLAAANGSPIEVYGEAELVFERGGGRRGGMIFVDANVNKPLAAVSAMVDEGNSVVFSKKWGSYVVNDATGENIELVRRGCDREGKGGTFAMVLECMETKTKKKTDKPMPMDVDAAETRQGGGAANMVFMRRVPK